MDRETITEKLRAVEAIIKENFCEDKETGNYYFKGYLGEKKKPVALFPVEHDYETRDINYHVNGGHLAKIRKEYTKLHSKDERTDKQFERYILLKNEILAIVQIEGINASLGEVATLNGRL